MSSLYTDAAIVAVFPAAASMTPDQITQSTQDIAATYAYAQGNPGISEADLRAWGETQSIDPDRMTTALTLLGGAGKLFWLPEPGPLPSTAPQSTESSGSRAEASAPKRRRAKRKVSADE